MLPFRHSLQSNKRSQESKSRRARESKSQDSRLTTLRLLTHNRGFSLIELLISMAILGILLAAIATIVYSQNKHHAAQNEIVEMQNNARMAMDFVTRTMRGLDRNATDAMLAAEGCWYNEWSMTEGENLSNLTFITDETDFGGRIDTHWFMVRTGTDVGVDGANTLIYGLKKDGGVLPGYERGTRQPLALNITYFSLRRMNEDGTYLTYPKDDFVDAEKIRIIIEAETENKLPTTGKKAAITLKSYVHLRN